MWASYSARPVLALMSTNYAGMFISQMGIHAYL